MTLTDLPKKRALFLLRGTLATAIGGLVLTIPPGSAFLYAGVLLGAFMVSMVALLLMPEDVVRFGRFDLGLVLIDTLFLVAFLNYAAGSAAGSVFFTFFLVVLLAAATVKTSRALGMTSLAVLMYAWFAYNQGQSVMTAEFLLRLPFFFAASLYYVYFISLTADREEQAGRDLHERDHLRAVLDVMQSTTSSLDIHQVMFEVTSRVADMVGGNRCSVMMIDPETDPGKAFVLASSDNPMVDMLPIELERYPEVRKAIETREPVILSNIMEDDLMVEVRDQLRSLGFRSLMVLPMFHADRLVGSMVLRCASVRHFAAREVYLARVVASASANAVKNALLYRDTLRQNQLYRETSEKLQRILDGSPDLIITTDTSGRMTEFNEGGCRTLGYTRREMLNRPFSTLFLQEAEYATLWKRSIDGDNAGDLNVSLHHRDGSKREVSFTFSSFQGTPGGPAGLVAVGRDITEQRRHQEQLQLAYRLSSMGDVIANVAHELNNPLSAVVGYSQLMMTKETPGSDLRMLKAVHDGASRCQRIVQNLLSFSCKHPSEKRYLGVNGILEKVLDLKEYRLQADGITVDKHFDDRLPRTLVDFHQMEQVFLNLVNNAHQALMEVPEGRRIVIKTRCDGEMIRIEVIDNGPGIAEEVLDRVFDPFFTTRSPEAGGAGLGLSISFGIVRDHGGTIGVQSSPGLGARFHVDIPVVECPEEEVQQKTVRALGEDSDNSAKRILVVDDEPAILDLFIDVLERFPLQVDTARNGTEAMRKILEGAYDLVISDLVMPGMDGPTFYREIGRRRPDVLTRLVFTTGDHASGPSSDFLERAGRPVIHKPIDIRRLVEVVSEATGTRPTS